MKTDEVMETDEWLMAADASRMLGVVPATVRQLALQGRLPSTRTASGVHLFRRRDVLRLAEERARRRERAKAGRLVSGEDER